MIPLLAGAFTLAAVWIWMGMSKVYPNLSIVQLAVEVAGRPVGGLIALLYIWYFIQTSSWVTRNLGDFMKTILMPNTPITVFHIMFLGIACYAAIKGIETIARTSEILTPLVIFVMVTIYLCAMKEWDWSKLEPMFQTSFAKLVKDSGPVIGFPYLETVSIMMLAPHVKSRLRTSLLLGMTLATLLLSGIVLVTVGVLGAPRSGHLLYPLYTIVKELQIAEFIENLESTIVIGWTVWIFLKLCIAYYCAVIGICQLFKLKNRAGAAIPLIFLIAGIAITLNDNVIGNIVWDKRYIFQYSCFYGMVLPLLLWMLGKFKKRRRKGPAA
ncbi:germination protein GerKB [Paenibacillus radicis (ex Gao et al. 2016)]|uniref:Germination protein GerKB n=2 Tax=Paenibacillus radicis (ex Gao et al. 2016) TaxID=1737354 RepID=A0A917GXC8_9BACL|nr:germination protein GerKB [Paenibacillus radicis (ex Gao et al. 2016)]